MVASVHLCWPYLPTLVLSRMRLSRESAARALLSVPTSGHRYIVRRASHRCGYTTTACLRRVSVTEYWVLSKKKWFPCNTIAREKWFSVIHSACIEMHDITSRRYFRICRNFFRLNGANTYSATKPMSNDVSTYSHLLVHAETFSIKMYDGRHFYAFKHVSSP